MKRFGFLIALVFLFAACGSSPKHVSSSKESKKNNAKHSSQKYVPAGNDDSLEDTIYSSLGHRRGTGVRYSQYVEPNGKFDIPIVYNDAVQKWIDYFTGNGSGHYAKYLARSGRFIPYMHAVLDKYNLPHDLVYLSMIESGFNTRAMSWAAAGGLWQFIKSTGSMYGLSVDYYVDERADVEKATDAAARHLKDLYDEFGNWYLAFAAYNAGAGKVRNAINRHGTDFWDMARGSYLRQETKDYVPKIIAAAIIGKNPRKYGFDHVEYQVPINYERVQLKSATDLEVAAECAGVEPDLMRLLNPELLRDMTPPHIPNYSLKIPKGTKERFMRKYAALSPSQRLKTIYYTVQRGDTLREIAGNYGVSERDLVSENSGKIDVDRDKHSRTEKVAVRKGKKVKYVKKKVTYTTVSYDVDPGTVLAIPKNRSVAKNASSRDDAAAHAAKGEFGLRMASADDLDTKGKKKKNKKKQEKEQVIAQAEPSAEAASAPAAEAAPVARPAPQSDLDPSLIESDPRVGRDPRIAAAPAAEAPAAQPAASAPAAGPVAMNDRPADLASTQGVPVEPSQADLKAAVDGLRPKSDTPAVEGETAQKEWISEGEEKTLPASDVAAAEPPPAKPAKTIYHKVQNGETLNKIADKYGVTVEELKTWNGKKVVPYPRSGTKILVKGSGASRSTAPTTVAKKGAPQKSTSYVVKSGDTLTSIAARNGVTVEQLTGWNEAKLKNGLMSGSKLSLAGSPPAVSPAKKAGAAPQVAKAAPKKSVVKYKVKPGDSLVKIAKQHSTTPEAIRKLNGLKSPKIVPGAVLVVKN